MRYPRLKSENIHPIDAPISRSKARELLVDYLGQIRFTSEMYLNSAAEPFDWAADEYDQKVDDKYFNAIDNTELEVELAAEEVNDLKREIEDCKDNPRELKSCTKELAAAEKKLKRHQAALEKAEARRNMEKSDYRKLLIKVANQIVREEERM